MAIGLERLCPIVVRIGRFGVKAQRATLVDFAGDAYRNELGITNEIEPTEIAPGGDADLLGELDRVADPEGEIRTPPLWGLRYRTRLLHDGSALGIAAAVAAHREEAESVRARFDALDPAQRDELVAFLSAL